MSTQRIAIIGCGYVGSALGEALVAVGHDVVGTTTSPDRLERIRSLGITPVIVDIEDVDALHDTIRERDAAYLTIAPREPGADYRDVYLKAAKNLVMAVVGTPVFRILYTSSTRVYGQDRGQWVDETSPTQPQDMQGEALLATENTLLNASARHGRHQGSIGVMRTSVVRLSGIYGPQRDPKRRIITAAGTQRHDGDAWINMIHLDDIVLALLALLETDHHGVLNLSDDQPTTRREYYDRVLEEADLPPIRWLESDLSPRRGKRVSNECIRDLLGLQLTHPTH